MNKTKTETTVESINYLKGLGKLSVRKDAAGKTTAKLVVNAPGMLFEFVARSLYGGSDAIRLLNEKVKNEEPIVKAILGA